MYRHHKNVATVRWTRAGMLFGTALFALVAFANLPAAADTKPRKQVADGFTVAGKVIEVERFEPKEAGMHPAIILLHGSAGLEKCGPIFRMGAQIVAREGFVVLLVHYFDRTDTKEIEPKDITKIHFTAWQEVVRQAVTYAGKQAQVDAKRIGLLGFSLGACLALSVATEANSKVAVVVDWFGKLPQELRAGVKRLPPMLIVHGDADQTVPVAEAYALEDLLETNCAEYELKIYQKQAHLFLNNPYGAEAGDARQRTLAFLAKHLKGADPITAAQTIQGAR